jgi:hypothetical protein
MFAQFAPLVSQRCHWYAKLIGRAPLQVPGLAVKVCPCCADPEIVGGETFDGGLAATTEVGTDEAVADPPELLAVTATTIVLPTSALVTV